jgi:hypothetical protein
MNLVSILSIFVLACLAGYYVVRSVTPALDITDVAPLGIKAIYMLDPKGNAIAIAQKVSG